ncbi:Hypothetical_protein [Hexamita inflata]|uniref:Hypothetical_protein n=1 Tax=Hexamita inflata TaxID=28002 RepID=A0ABP1HLL0_9EUKA
MMKKVTLILKVLLLIYTQVSHILIFSFQLKQFSKSILSTLISQANTAVLQQRANEEAKLHYTSLITNALHEGTIATKQGQRDRQATGRRALRAPPGLEGAGAKQEGGLRQVFHKQFRHFISSYTTINYLKLVVLNSWATASFQSIRLTTIQICMSLSHF